MHDPRARCQHCVFSAIRWQLAFLEVAWPRVNGDARAIIDLPTNISSSPHPPNNIAVTPPPQTSQRSSHRFKQTGGRTTPNKPAVAPPLQTKFILRGWRGGWAGEGGGARTTQSLTLAAYFGQQQQENIAQATFVIAVRLRNLSFSCLVGVILILFDAPCGDRCEGNLAPPNKNKQHDTKMMPTLPSPRMIPKRFQHVPNMAPTCSQDDFNAMQS